MKTCSLNLINERNYSVDTCFVMPKAVCRTFASFPSPVVCTITGEVVTRHVAAGSVILARSQAAGAG